MFGYIIINKAELKFKEYDVYHSFYCGLCQVLKERYGRSGQLTLSYDMTFLLMLLTGLYEPQTFTDSCKCIIHPLEKHTVRRNQYTEYIADMNMLFSYYKCLDDWEDDKQLHKLCFAKLLNGKVGRQKEQYQEKLRTINLLMHDLKQAEQANSQDIDAMAGKFGKIMAEIVACKEDEWTESLRRLGFYLGEFIYFLDAYEDIEEDIKKSRYNPLKSRYESIDFEEECRSVLTMMMAECCKEFEKLPILENVEILRNILYSGVWCRYEGVREKRLNKAKEDK
ncbi:MAG: hypothetical protein IJ379_07770 [Lachnospiraceae bacterium]|nr:hypothetical protein [Lachnospiraceae bacterium]